MSNVVHWLFRGGGKQPERFAGMRVQTSAWGAGMPIVYGTNRLPGNLIYTADFVATTAPVKHGGKIRRIIGKDQASGGGTYYEVTAILALCEGPISGINTVWADAERKTLSWYGWTLFTGSISQAVWGFLTTNHPTEAVPYSGTAYLAAAPLQLGSTNTLQNFSFEVQGFNIIGGGNQDAHPADIIPDFLSNARYGAGLDASRIGNLGLGQDGTAGSSYRRYCTASGFFLSPVIAGQKTAADHLKEFLEATNADAVFSQGVLNIFPYGDQPVTGNSVTFTPATTPIYDLTADDFLVSSPGDDPVTVVRAALSDTFNTVPVEYNDRGTDYDHQIVQNVEPRDAAQYGQRTSPTASLPCIARGDAALQISGIKALRSVYVRNTYKFKLGWSKILLDPMDLLTLTDTNLGLVSKVVRVKSIVENPDGVLDFTAEEWPFGVASATRYTTQAGSGETTNTAVDPGNVTTPYIFDIPFLWNDATNPRIGIAVSGGQWWGGCEVWISADGVTYSLAGILQGKSRYGVTSSALASGSGFDTTHTVDVDLTLSGGSLVSITDDAAQAFMNLAILDGELLSFATATLIATNKYTLSRIQRGGYGTAGASHLTATKFARLDDAIFYYDIPSQYLGTTLHFKFVSINVFGGGKQDISAVVDYTFTPSTTVGIDPPYPASVSLAITTTQPALPAPSPTNPWRSLTHEQAQGGRATLISQVLKILNYATVSWSAVSIYPASLLTKYRVVVYKGSDPNDESARVHTFLDVDPDALSLIVALNPYDTSLTLSAAVQAWYGTDPSSWRTSAGTVVLSPGTVPLTLPLVFELTQTASDRSSVTFSVTLRDPVAGYSSITVDIAWAGFTSVIDNGTASPVGATKVMTLGTAYSFTANLNPQFRGQGYVKFHAAATGRADGYATWFGAETDQDAAPSVEIAILSNQSSSVFTAKASMIVNAPNNASTMKWLASTSAAPSSASVAATGATVSGGSPFTVADLGVALNLGDTVFVGIIPYDSFGTAGQFIQAKAVRASITASKTARYPAIGAFVPVGPNLSLVRFSLGGGAWMLNGTPPQTTNGVFLCHFTLPENCLITDVYAGVYCAAGGDAQSDGLVYPVDNDGVLGGFIAHIQATQSTVGWQTKHASGIGQTTTGTRFIISHELRTNGSIDDSAMSYYDVVYTSADTQASI